MKSKIHRCGWCGIPTDENGTPLEGDACKKAVRIITKYGDRKSKPTHGYCCINMETCAGKQLISRDMAIDAGDMSLEGQEIKWF